MKTDQAQPETTAAVEPKFHRFRFYQGKWSTFDSIKQCDRPGPCMGCTYGHPICDKNGRVLQEQADG